MALFRSQLVTAISGSVGGITYAHATGGMYMRARSQPVNTNTAFQQQVRAALTQLVVRWTEILTAAQRTAWDLYGTNVPVTNALGDTINLSGQNWYVAANTPRLQLNSKAAGTIVDTPVDAAPVIFDRGDFTTPTVVSDVSSGTIVSFDVADAWNLLDTSGLLIYQGRPRNLGRNYFSGPWRLIAGLNDGATTPTTITPANIAARGFPYAVGQKVAYAFAVSQTDGRLSTRRIVDTTVIA